MSSSAAVHLDGRVIDLRAGESVLEGLERAGLDTPSGCRAGSCCKCMLQAENPPAASQRSLRPTLRKEGFFLACQAYPEEALFLTGTRPPEPTTATILSTRLVAPDVRQLVLGLETPFTFRPGQYLDVLHPTGEIRSYSIASLPTAGGIELHVRQVPGGRVSSWLHGLQSGAALRVRGAFGQCFYAGDDRDKKLLLIGAGTGLAPLLGIARDALAQGHRGAIELIHGGLEPARLYLRNELARLAKSAPNLHIHHCVLRDATESEHEGNLDEVAIQLAGSLENTRAVVCGDPGIVRTLQRSLFLAGLASREILADAFESPPAKLA